MFNSKIFRLDVVKVEWTLYLINKIDPSENMSRKLEYTFDSGIGWGNPSFISNKVIE